MGYYTKYELTVSDGCNDLHAEGIAEISGYRSLEESVKWYDHEEHMLAYSKRHPSVIFILDGEGEDSGDVWRKWFRNGEMQVWKADVTPPPSPPDSWRTTI